MLIVPTNVSKKLRSLFEFDNIARRLMLIQKFYTLKLIEGKCMEDKLCTIGTIVAQLASIGIIFNDQELVDIVIKGFLPNWSTFSQI